jgi:hypothetical protein
MALDTIINIVIGVFSFFGGIIFQNKRIKRENVHGKIVSIDSSLVVPLKGLIDEKLKLMEIGDNFEFSTKNDLVVNEMMNYSYFENFILSKSDAFERSGNQLIVSYNGDKILIRKGKEIIDGLVDYKEKLDELKEFLPEIDRFPQPYVIDDIAKLLLTIKRNIGDLKGPQFKKDIVKISLSVALNNESFFPRGHTVRIELQTKKLSELQIIYEKDTDYFNLLKEFKIRHESVYNSLISIKNNLVELHKEWRDEYDI